MALWSKGPKLAENAHEKAHKLAQGPLHRFTDDAL